MHAVNPSLGALTSRIRLIMVVTFLIQTLSPCLRGASDRALLAVRDGIREVHAPLRVNPPS